MVCVGVVQGQRVRHAIVAVFAASLGLAASCGESNAPVAPRPPDDPCAAGPPIACFEQLRSEAARLEGSAECLAVAHRLVELCARAVEGSEQQACLPRAAEALRLAVAHPRVPGACEAHVELARFMLEVQRDALSAAAELYRIERRYPGSPCAVDAAGSLGWLRTLGPDPITRARIDHEPESAAPSAPSAPSARSLEVLGEASAQSVRVVLALDGPAEFSVDDPGGAGSRRVVLSLPTVNLEAIPAAREVGIAGLQRVRTEHGETESRLVFELAASAELRAFALVEPFRVVVDVRPQLAAPVAGTPILVLDPGHGGNDYGARAFGLQEADITLDLAVRVRRALATRMPGLRVVLTRESDTFVSLEQRAAMANAIGASMFVSIHLNAAWEPVEHGGITTFVLDTTQDRQAVRLAARENGTSTGEVGDLSRMLAGLQREAQLEGSRMLAEALHRGTLSQGRTILPRLHDRGVRSAMFYVLVGATMPAVLLEASFMTRPDEAAALRTEAYRAAIANGIADGLVAYVVSLR